MTFPCEVHRKGEGVAAMHARAHTCVVFLPGGGGYMQYAGWHIVGTAARPVRL
jgi:hypothetical protein